MSDWKSEAIERDSNNIISYINSNAKMVNRRISYFLAFGVFISMLGVISGISLKIALIIFTIYAIIIIFRYWLPIIFFAKKKMAEMSVRATERQRTGMASETELSTTPGESDG